MHAQARQMAPASYKAYLRELLYLDASPTVKEVHAPVLLLASDKTWQKGATWGAVAKSLGYEDSTAVVGRHLAGTGHFLQLDVPDSVVAAITEMAGRVLAP